VLSCGVRETRWNPFPTRERTSRDPSKDTGVSLLMMTVIKMDRHSTRFMDAQQAQGIERENNQTLFSL
jgi:hypothetical protein